MVNNIIINNIYRVFYTFPILYFYYIYTFPTIFLVYSYTLLFIEKDHWSNGRLDIKRESLQNTALNWKDKNISYIYYKTISLNEKTTTWHTNFLTNLTTLLKWKDYNMAHKFVDKLNYTSEMKRPVVIMAHKSENRETPQSQVLVSMRYLLLKQIRWQT